MSLLGDFRMREARIKAATRWSPTTATNIRHKRLGTSFRVSGTSSEGVVESHQDVPHRPGPPASPPIPRPEGHEQPPLCPEALERPAGTQGRSRTACKTETTKGGHARKRNDHRSDSTLSLPGKGRSRQERLRETERQVWVHAPSPKREYQDFRGWCPNMISFQFISFQSFPLTEASRSRNPQSRSEIPCLRRKGRREGGREGGRKGGSLQAASLQRTRVPWTTTHTYDAHPPPPPPPPPPTHNLSPSLLPPPRGLPDPHRRCCCVHPPPHLPLFFSPYLRVH